MKQQSINNRCMKTRLKKFKKKLIRDHEQLRRYDPHDTSNFFLKLR